MVLEGGLISQPEEYEDVKGQVTSDYQDELEKIWEDELRNKYNVKLYSKVLDTLR